MTTYAIVAVTSIHQWILSPQKTRQYVANLAHHWKVDIENVLWYALSKTSALSTQCHKRLPCCCMTTKKDKSPISCPFCFSDRKPGIGCYYSLSIHLQMMWMITPAATVSIKVTMSMLYNPLSGCRCRVATIIYYKYGMQWTHWAQLRYKKHQKK